MAMRKLADDSEIADDIIGFHVEQAVEKWPKAVIGNRGTRFEYRQDLCHLIELARAAVDDFPFEIGAVIALTEYAVPLRYDELLDVEPLDREATVALVQEDGRWAPGQLKAPEDSGEMRPGYLLPEDKTMRDVLCIDAELLGSEGLDPVWSAFEPKPEGEESASEARRFVGVPGIGALGPL